MRAMRAVKSPQARNPRNSFLAMVRRNRGTPLLFIVALPFLFGTASIVPPHPEAGRRVEGGRSYVPAAAKRRFQFEGCKFSLGKRPLAVPGTKLSTRSENNE